MTRQIRIAVCLLTITLALVLTEQLHAQGIWQYSRNQFDRREVHTRKNVTVFGTPCSALLTFICTQDSKDKHITGMLSLEFTISPASKVHGFDFEYFEGPGAPGGGQTLMTITLVSGEKHSRFQVPLSGWWSADVDDGFTFGTSTPTRDRNGYMRKIVAGILGGAESIEIEIVDGPRKKKAILATFPVSADRHHFQAMMQGMN